MAKKIRFPLVLADGTQARSLDELKEHFDLESVLGHYKSGKLLTWLRDRYIEDEADAVEALDENAPDFQQKLCAVFGVEFSGSGADIEEIARRQKRLAKLRQFTDTAEFIQNIDAVAFDQEELADLLDEGCEKIYLCSEKFTVPASLRGRTYIGINHPQVRISGRGATAWDKLEITVSGCEVDGMPASAENSSDKSGFSCLNRPVNDITEDVADSIYQQVRVGNYIETNVYILTEDSSGICLTSKIDGSKNTVLPKSEFSGMRSYQLEKWPFTQEHIFAFFEKVDDDDIQTEEDFEEMCDTRLSVYQIDLKQKTAAPLGFKIDPFNCAVTNGKALALSMKNGEVFYVDLERRKKYPLRRKTNGGTHDITCTGENLYFVSEDDELIKYTFETKKEAVVCEVDFRDECHAISFFEDKVFLCLGNTIGYVDLGYRKHHKFVTIQDRYASSTIIVQADSLIFLDDEEDEDESDCYTIKHFDFKTLEVTDIAPQCNPYGKPKGLEGIALLVNSFFYSKWRHTDNHFLKVGNWIYYFQGGAEIEVRVSLNQPMEVEPVGSDLDFSLELPVEDDFAPEE